MTHLNKIIAQQDELKARSTALARRVSAALRKAGFDKAGPYRVAWQRVKSTGYSVKGAPWSDVPQAIVAHHDVSGWQPDHTNMYEAYALALRSVGFDAQRKGQAVYVKGNK